MRPKIPQAIQVILLQLNLNVIFIFCKSYFSFSGNILRYFRTADCVNVSLFKCIKQKQNMHKRRIVLKVFLFFHIKKNQLLVK